ncbi:MAG: hypothetical protein RLN76_04465 [Phycisphaeraceae bacterium]
MTQTAQTRPSVVAEFLLQLGQAGVELAIDPGNDARLRYRPSDLGADLRQQLSDHKPHLLALLRGEALPDEHDSNTEAGYVLGERLGIAEDLGMPVHPGSPAWLVAVGEALLTMDPDRKDT